MKTTKRFETDRKWHVVDAEGQTLGRLAVVIANKLSGREKVDFTPGVDNGDFVVVINCGKISVTGKKLDDKMYYRHSGHKGNLKEQTLGDKLEKRPLDPVRLAVRGMLPKNKLRDRAMARLKLVEGTEHKFGGQQPEELTINS